MNKYTVNGYISKACKILNDVGIVEEDKGKKIIDSTYRSQISSFGAAIAMGSLPAAVAFFSQNGNATIDRPKLMEAIRRLIGTDKENLFEYVKDGGEDKKEKVVNAAIALKLAMNLFELK